MNQWSKPYTRRVTAVAPQQQLLLLRRRQHQQIPRHQAYADHTSTIVNYPDRSGTGERIRNKLPTTPTKRKRLRTNILSLFICSQIPPITQQQQQITTATTTTKYL